MNNNDEAGVFVSHLRVTNPDYTVLAIGLGNGTTLIPIVKLMEASSKGFYRGIEASESQIIKAMENIKINNLNQNKFEIINAYAGNIVFNSYGTSSKEIIDINDFDFDVLEMDCEGSELSILQSLYKNPKYIIVELHPWLFDHHYRDFDNFLHYMMSKGYQYHFSYGQNGDYLDISYARKYYNFSSSRTQSTCSENLELHYFGSCPIVVTFAYKSGSIELS